MPSATLPRARALLAFALLASLGLAAGCGGSSKAEPVTGPSLTPATAQASLEGPDEFLKRLLGYGYAGEHGRMWNELHPAVKALVARERFVECASLYQSPVELVSIETIEVSDEPIDAPGIPEKTTKTVALSLTVAIPGQAPFSVVSTLHVFLVDGRWAWIPKSGAFEAYREGRCPTQEDEEAAGPDGGASD